MEQKEISEEDRDIEKASNKAIDIEKAMRSSLDRQILALRSELAKDSDSPDVSQIGNRNVRNVVINEMVR